MSVSKADWIWHEGKWERWEEATVHVTAHALHYGSSVFEGIRAYETQAGPATFRLDDHSSRFFDSAKLLRMDLGELTHQRVGELCEEIVIRNGHASCYIRPLAFRNVGAMGLNPLPCDVVVTILSFEWGRYLGAEAIEKALGGTLSAGLRTADLCREGENHGSTRDFTEAVIQALD